MCDSVVIWILLGIDRAATWPVPAWVRCSSMGGHGWGSSPASVVVLQLFLLPVGSAASLLIHIVFF